MTLTQTYEVTRDLLTGMAYHRGTTLVAQREYTYDILGRPTARNTARNGQIVNDTFAHNTRSELTAATVNGADYEYAYDNIGNRQQATVGNDVTVYDANALNQYTAISENGAAAFVPQFDTDGNQTLIKTDTGIWSAVYNAENRPVTFTNSDSNTVVECQYDSMGRRAFKKVTINGSVTLHQRYIYRGYLQIACVDLTRSHHPVMWLVTWDPTQPVATRPLAIRINGTWYTYGWDLTKNICELYSTEGRISTSYTYSPFGKVTATGSLTQPIQWSSEMWDGELGLVYYNWRYYNLVSGGWNRRDPLYPCEYKNLYTFTTSCLNIIDMIGLGEYSIGYGDEPPMSFDNDFRLNPYEKASFVDYINRMKWGFLLSAAKRFRPELIDATRAYQHFLNGQGSSLWVDYAKAYENDPVIRAAVDKEIIRAQRAAEYLWNGESSFYITGTAKRVAQPETENWQKTIGEHYIWGRGIVTVRQKDGEIIFDMNITINEKDKYNFNLNAEDCATGISDNENGRFEVLGWGRSFFTHGEITKSVSWKCGSSGTLQKQQKINRSNN